MANANLHKAKTGKNDEFYTQLTDIEKELMHYKEHFKDKTVLCNCDDPKESAFWKYFDGQFNRLGLKRLIATHYEQGKQSYVLDRTRMGEESPTVIKNLTGDGDFRSEECIELLKQADIVVTNPPFSLFRQYIAQLMEYDKKFIIIGHQNAITYQEVFPLLKDNRMWLGFGFKGGAAHFINKHYIDYATASDHKEGMIRVSGVVWFTNLDIRKRHEGIDLYERYVGNEEHYPKYDNFDAIEVGKTVEIPKDYTGVMGVPITFMDKYSPDQFEIVGLMATTKVEGYNYGYPYINGKKKYARILIKRKEKPHEN